MHCIKAEKGFLLWEHKLFYVYLTGRILGRNSTSGGLVYKIMLMGEVKLCFSVYCVLQPDCLQQGNIVLN